MLPASASPSTLSPYAPSTLAEAEALAQRLAESPLMPDSLKKRPGDILIIMMTGHELGLSPMAAIRGLYVINGRVGIYSALAVSLVKKHGACEHFTLVESTAQRATYKTKRRGEAETTMTFTLEQARVAGYLTKGPWRATPEAMLRARAARALAETVYPDALFGMPWDDDDADEALVAQSEPKTIEAAAAASITAGVVAELPAAHDDAVVDAPVVVDPVADMLSRIEKASTLAELRSLAGPITKARLGSESRVRDAYNARQGQMNRVGGVK